MNSVLYALIITLLFSLNVSGQKLPDKNPTPAIKNKDGSSAEKPDKKKEQSQQVKEAQKKIIRVKFKDNFALKLENSEKKKSADGIIQTGQTPLDKLNKQYGVTSMKRLYRHGGKFEQKHRKYGLHLWYELEIVDGAKRSDAISSLSKMAEVITAEPVYEKYREADLLTVKEASRNVVGFLKNPPNDPQLNEQWHFYNNGQNGGTKGADIKLMDAWQSETGNPNVIVAVVDGGIDVNHSDLAANMWINTGEIANNGIDDDNNGFIDDVYGYNFVENSGTIHPDFHGTHVGGTVAAVTNNNVGVSGIAGGNGSGDGARLMSLAVFSEWGAGGFNESYIYAADNGAVISQNSWGYIFPGSYEQSVLDAIDYFIAEAGFDENGKPRGPMQGGIVVFAAGNGGSDNLWYPGYYEPVLAVAASDRFDNGASFSNFGSWVELAAPGFDVYSTMPGNSYDYLSGTSMACPHVSGVAALIVSKFAGKITPQQLRDRLVETTDKVSTLPPGFGTGRLNAFNALQEDDGLPPTPVSDLAISEIFFNRLTLSWTAPFDPGNGKASSYVMRYSTEPISETNFNSAQSVSGLPPAASAGEIQSFTLTGLNSLSTYYFALKSADFFGNLSPISNIASGTTDTPPVISISPDSYEIVIDVEKNPIVSEKLTIANEGTGASLEFTLSSNLVSRNQIKLLYPGQGLSSVDMEKYGKGNLNKAIASKTSGESQKQSSIATLANGMDSLYYDSGDNIAEDFIGFGYDPLTSAVRFEVTQPAFTLTHIRNFMRTEFINNPTIIVEIYKGIEITSAELQLSQTVQLESSSGEFFIIPMETPQSFNSGDVFWVVIKYPWGINYPQGIDFNHPVRPNTFYLSWNGGYDYFPVDEVLKIRALSGVGNWINFEPASAILGAGETLDVKVIFDATNVYNGNYLYNILVNSDDPNMPTINVPAEVTVIGQQPAIKVNKELLEFGAVFLGGNKSLPVSIKNEGMADLEINSINSTNPVFSTDRDNVTIGPKEEVILNVIFLPTETANSNGKLTINSNDPKQSALQIVLVGIGAEPPVISVNPEQIITTLPAGDTGSETITISNSGNYPLQFSFPEFAIQRLLSDPSVKKNNTTPLNIPARNGSVEKNSKEAGPKGHPVVLGAGSDNSFGYTWIDSDTEGGPSFIWEDISETGISILEGVDDAFEHIPLPFTFKYYGQTKNSIYISSNGILTFGEGTFNFSNDQIPTSWEPNDFIAPFWDDLHLFNDFSKIYYRASPQGLIVQYDAVSKLVGRGSITFQVKILSNGRIYFYYKDVSSLEISNEATIGIENSTGTDGIQVVYNNDYIKDNLAVLIIPPVPKFISGVSKVSGVVPVNQSIDIQILLSAVELYDGVYNQNLMIESNDPINSPVGVPFTLTVVGIPEISVIPTVMNFDSVFFGISKVKNLTIQNSGTKDLVVSSITTSSEYFSVAFDSEIIIEPKNEISLPVNFTPDAIGLVEDELIIISNGSEGDPVIVILRGIGVDPPVISIMPESIYAEVASGELAFDTLLISNLGESRLDYSIPATFWIKPKPAIKSDAAKLAAAEVMPIKGSVDSRSGKPVQFGGGTDFIFGYTWEDNKDGGGPVFSWNEIVDTGIDITSDLQTGAFADGHIEVPIEFSFLFYGASYTSVYVSASGILFFEEISSSTYINHRIPVPDEVNNLIAGFWSDLEPGTIGGTVHYKATPEAFIAQYTNVARLGFESDNNITFQIILYPNGKIKIQYLDVSSAEFLHSGTVGIENATGTDGIEVVFNNYYIQDKLAIEFSRPMVRSVAPGQTVRVPIVLDASHLNDGTYHDIILVHSNDPLTPVVEIPVTLNVSGMPDIEVWPETLDFGTLFVHQDSIFHAHQIVIVRNGGSKELLISEMYLKDPSAFSVEFYGPLALAPGEETYFFISFSPTAVSLYQTDLVIVSDDANDPELIISLQGEGMEPPVFNASTPGDAIIARLKSNEVGYGSINISNNGGSILHYNANVSYFSEGSAVLANIPAAIKPLAKPGKATSSESEKFSIPASISQISSNGQSFKDSLFYEGSPYPDSFLGTGGYAQYSVATKFESPSSGFVLSHIRNFYRTEGSGEEIFMAVYAGGSSPETARLIIWQQVIGGTEDGDFNLISLIEPIGFGAGETFWIIFYYPWDIEHPQGINFGTGETEGIYWESYDQGASWYPLYYEYIPKVRALQSIDEWISLEPASGDLEPGTTEEVKVIMDASKLESGDHTASIIISTNDPFNPYASIPVRVHVNSPPSFIDPPVDILEVNQNELLTVVLKATDNDGQIIGYSLKENYENVTFSWSTVSATLKFQPDHSQSGYYNFTVEAMDDAEEVIQVSFIVNVLGVNRPPVLARKIKNQNVKKGESQTLDLSGVFSDPNLDQLSFKATATNPSLTDLRVTGNSLQITGLLPGKTMVSILADDGKEGIAGTSFQLKITGGKKNDKKAVKESEDSDSETEIFSMQELINYPNPFTGETTISYSLKEASYVKLQVFTVLGLSISTLADEVQGPGKYSFTFNATALPSGIYLYRLQVAETIITKRMVIK